MGWSGRPTTFISAAPVFLLFFYQTWKQGSVVHFSIKVDCLCEPFFAVLRFLRLTFCGEGLFPLLQTTDNTHNPLLIGRE